MTYAPATLRDLAAYWKAQGGVNLGIVGDTDHAVKGVSYHLGKDQLLPGAYSATTVRDRAGLTNAASAIDLGKLNGSYPQLRKFSDWLARLCVKGGQGTNDIREVIYSPDGKRVLGFKDGIDFLIPDYGDLSHRTHTHISYYRDSEKRDKRPLFVAYFGVPDTSEETDVAIRSKVIDPTQGIVTVTGAGHALVTFEGRHVAVPAGQKREALAKVELLEPLDDNPGDRKTAYLVGAIPGQPNSELAYLLAVDGTFAGPAKRIVALTINGVVSPSPVEV